MAYSAARRLGGFRLQWREAALAATMRGGLLSSRGLRRLQWRRGRPGEAQKQAREVAAVAAVGVVARPR